DAHLPAPFAAYRGRFAGKVAKGERHVHAHACCQRSFTAVLVRPEREPPLRTRRGLASQIPSGRPAARGSACSPSPGTADESISSSAPASSASPYMPFTV